MTHIKYHTDGILLESHDVGETDRLYLILTEDFGLVWGKARGVRTLSSKLRQTLEELSLVNLTLVESRQGWRVVSATLLRQFYPSLLEHPNHRERVRRALTLVRRLVPQEEKNCEIFRMVRDGLQFLCRNHLTDDEAEGWEVLFVLRLLFLLGYLGSPRRFAYILASSHMNDMMLYETARSRKHALWEINRALQSVDL